MKIYVGNLTNEIDKDDIKKAFEDFGKVSSVKMKKDQFSGETKGYGFVEMLATKEAETAIKELDGKELKGQILVVREARSESTPWKTMRRGQKRPF